MRLGRLITVAILLAATVWQAIVPCTCVICCHPHNETRVEGRKSEPAKVSRCRHRCPKAAASEHGHADTDQVIALGIRESLPDPAQHHESCRKSTFVAICKGEAQQVVFFESVPSALPVGASRVIPRSSTHRASRWIDATHRQFAIEIISTSRLRV